MFWSRTTQKTMTGPVLFRRKNDRANTFHDKQNNGPKTFYRKDIGKNFSLTLKVALKCPAGYALE